MYVATPRPLRHMRGVHSAHAAVDSSARVQFGGEQLLAEGEGQNPSNSPSCIPRVSSSCPHFANAAVV